MNLLITVTIGVGATLVMDLWQIVLKQFGVATLNFALLGRWAGHVLRGEWTHPSIAKATPVANELALGRIAHYATGIAFAALLLFVVGLDWVRAPSLAPALAVGTATVLAPLLVMQPAMGAGVAFSKTPRPLFNSVKSLVNHFVFGLGLYVAAHCLSWYSTR